MTLYLICRYEERGGERRGEEEGTRGGEGREGGGRREEGGEDGRDIRTSVVLKC